MIASLDIGFEKRGIKKRESWLRVCRQFFKGFV